MILLIIIGIAAYFILPLLIVMFLLERNDNRILGWYADVSIVGWGTVFIELVLLIQILVWIGVL